MAIDQKYLDLINADIDGDISDADRADLDAFLAQNSEARAAQSEFQAFCAALDSIESEDPPPHMRHDIINALPPATAEARMTEPGFLHSLIAAPALRYAASFAVGVFLTLSLVNSSQISNQAFDDVTGLVGTVAEPVNVDTASTVAIDKSAVAGTVSLRSAGSILILDFDLVAAQPIEIEADYTDRTIWFNGFAQLESSGTSVSAENGRVVLGMEGKRRYAVYLQNEGDRETTVNLRFKADGEVVHEASLDFEPAP